LPSETQPNQAPILIVEDDRKTASLIALYLEREGYHTVVAYDGESALQLASDRKPMFVVLDLMLPRLDGWEVCRRLRKTSEVPILILTARDEEVDRVAGLTLGADDYVVKPFSPRELVARVKAILRRAHNRPAKEIVSVLSHRGLALDPEKQKVTLQGQRIELTHHEFKLLHALMAAPGRVFSRDALLAYLYPNREAVVIDRVVDVHIGKIRQKLEKDPANPAFILTVRGSGYRFAEDEDGGPRNGERP
jgi:DNA-binding response OmpR family regulator